MSEVVSGKMLMIRKYAKRITTSYIKIINGIFVSEKTDNKVDSYINTLKYLIDELDQEHIILLYSDKDVIKSCIGKINDNNYTIDNSIDILGEEVEGNTINESLVNLNEKIEKKNKYNIYRLIKRRIRNG